MSPFRESLAGQSLWRCLRGAGGLSGRGVPLILFHLKPPQAILSSNDGTMSSVGMLLKTSTVTHGTPAHNIIQNPNSIPHQRARARSRSTSPQTPVSIPQPQAQGRSPTHLFTHRASRRTTPDPHLQIRSPLLNDEPLGPTIPRGLSADHAIATHGGSRSCVSRCTFQRRGAQ
ncbi:hypothetical protein DENSPDRAFT_329162 [Dentipellis sp. KUC8613]|nr:hypothetical protein DENSPDRAFT_329162 [Dentipellis sp. KUC8613]